MSPKAEQKADARPDAYTFGESTTPAEGERALALLALSHTPVEQRLYECMLAEVTAARTSVGAFTTRGLMSLARIYDHQKVRRGLAGLKRKFSIELQNVASDGIGPAPDALYVIHHPEVILARRRAEGLPPSPHETETAGDGFYLAVERLAGRYSLSLRQAQVVACCARGLTNAEIGERLSIGEGTVKFHMRNILAIFGVRRRTQLVSSLLIRELRLEEEPPIGD
ncbi:MAG: helix-turn-helix transcriptional regulator [Rubrivivax sp.]|nr:helix-turn-helix transcriptional regulator [Pyrinomonadaceae bacterium]